MKHKLLIFLLLLVIFIIIFTKTKEPFEIIFEKRRLNRMFGIASTSGKLLPISNKEPPQKRIIIPYISSSSSRTAGAGRSSSSRERSSSSGATRAKRSYVY